MTRFFGSGVLAAALIATLIPAPAHGATYDKLAYLTFNTSVQVPGATLGAGTYRFHLTNPDTSRNVLQVLSGDGSIVYAMFHTIPDFRVEATDTPTVTFREAPVGVPLPVKSIFYSGENSGYEFVYPTDGPNMFAENLWQPPIMYNLPPAAPKPVIEPAATAIPTPAAIALAEPAIEPAAEPVPAPVELPRTASPLPVVAVFGICAVLFGGGLWALRRRVG
jgi:hypothetical protein